MIYLTPGTEAATLANLARQLKPGGLLIAAFELTRQPWTNFTLETYDQLMETLALTKVARWSTWEQAPWRSADRYAVSVHRK